MPSVLAPLGSSQVHRDYVLAGFAEAVWLRFTSLPSLEVLPSSLFVEIADVIQELAARRLIAVDGMGAGPRLVHFPGPGGFEGFQVELAGAIVCRLEGQLGHANDLDLITRILPTALADTLVQVPRPGTVAHVEEYRLISSR